MPANYTLMNGSSKKVDPQRFLFNVDTLYYSALASNYDEVMQDGLMMNLQLGREQAEKFENEKHVIEIKLPRYQNPLSFEVLGKGKTAYSYQIRNEDYAFYFVRQEHEDNFPIYVQINQFKLWQMGVIDSYIETLHILAELGFEIDTCKPSRIDLCCHSDQFQFSTNDLLKLKTPKGLNDPDFQKLNLFENTFETVYYGTRGNYMLRIYNKTKELLAKNKYHFLQVYEEHGLTDDVWNVEFELSRKFLKNLEVDGEPDFFDDMDNLLSPKGLSTLWTNLTTEKFKMVRSLENDTMIPYWRVLAQGNDGSGSNGKSVFYQTNAYMCRVKDIDDSLHREIAQITGRLTKFAVNQELPEGVEPFNFALQRYYQMTKEEYSDKVTEFTDKLNRKQSKYAAHEINSLIKTNKAKKTPKQ
ncbi:hypothetical protein [Bacillus pumilus]|uniref:hypothetical protein n=1 Tax=Bacillus pumilus TaxID=1408 RepID=UPI00119D90AE|nr:hypothetical protein [Bacillus pumilus]